MVSENMEKALNGQLNAEIYSGYLYLSMASYFEDEDLAGFANWMRVQAEEELEHGMKFYDYIIRRGSSVTLTTIEGPQTEWDSPVAAFEHVLEHEKMVSGLINDLVDLAIEENIPFKLDDEYHCLPFASWKISDRDTHKHISC